MKKGPPDPAQMQEHRGTSLSQERTKVYARDRVVGSAFCTMRVLANLKVDHGRPVRTWGRGLLSGHRTADAILVRFPVLAPTEVAGQEASSAALLPACRVYGADTRPFAAAGDASPANLRFAGSRAHMKEWVAIAGRELIPRQCRNINDRQSVSKKVQGLCARSYCCSQSPLSPHARKPYMSEAKASITKASSRRGNPVSPKTSKLSVFRKNGAGIRRCRATRPQVACSGITAAST